MRLRMSAPVAVLLANAAAAAAPIAITGVTGAHDPSTLEQYSPDGFIYFCTGQDILSRTSTNMSNWSNGPAVFSTIPAWTTTAVPGFTGDFWAPDVSYFDGLYHMYYAVSTFGSQVSAIGLATNTTLNPASPNYDWVDQGEVIGSTNGSEYNTIDPSILVQPNGSIYMTFGSYWDGIYEVEINPATGKLAAGTPTFHLADNSMIEASYLYQNGGYYYLFVNFGMCCDGVNSTYNIRVGRSLSPTGPFLDASGVNMVDSGGTLLLGTQGKYIGPGQAGIFTATNGQDWLSNHYYDGTNDGAPTYELQPLYWTRAGWPSLTVGGNGASLTWNNSAGGNGQNWDIQGQSNWSSSATAGNPNQFYQGDGVTFNDNNNFANNPNAYNVALDSTVTAGYVVVNNSAHNYSISGSGGIGGTGSLTKTGTGALSLNTINTYSGGTIVNGGTLIVGVNGALPNAAVSVGTAGTLQLSTGIGLVALSSLTIAPGGVMDITNNPLVFNYGSSAADPVGAIAAALGTGYNGGAWTGPGIQSSTAAANPTKYAVGYLDGNHPADASAGTVEANQLIIAYTLAGDAFLQNSVGFDDLVVVAQNFGKTGEDWAGGNFTYDPNGSVGFADLVSVAQNFGFSSGVNGGTTGGGLSPAWDAVSSTVPEPSAVGLGVAATAGLLGRRRRGKMH
jgi:autotransporter-associated beta strand protein